MDLGFSSMLNAKNSMLQTHDSQLMTDGSMLNAQSSPLRDSYSRPIVDLRIAITDRCNYKCVYCRTGNDGAQYADLPIADYLRMAKVFVSLGVEKVRLTGGEPLLRKGIIELVRELSQLRTLEGKPLDIALTT